MNTHPPAANTPARHTAAKKEDQILGTYGMEEEDFGYAIRKEDTELLAKVNASLKKLMASPEWEALQKKYDLH